MLSETTRQRVVELRRRGLSYGEIAEAVNLSRNTTKSICRRAGVVPAVDAQTPARHCELCGAPFPNAVSGRRFCSDGCRMAWWHAHPERLNRKAIYTFTCISCANAFEAYGNKGRKYCSHACYIRDRFGTRGGRP